MMRYMFIAVLLASRPHVAIAKEAQSVIEDPVMEARVMGLSAELRCLVCQGQSLAESHADFAVDMRRKMQELMEMPLEVYQ